MKRDLDRRVFVEVAGGRYGKVVFRVDDVSAVRDAENGCSGCSICLVSGVVINTSASSDDVLRKVRDGYELVDKNNNATNNVFCSVLIKVTDDLKERMSVERNNCDCVLNAMIKPLDENEISESKIEQLKKEESNSMLDSLILFPDEKLVMASEVIKSLKKMANERGGYLNHSNIKKILSLAIETVTEE